MRNYFIAQDKVGWNRAWSQIFSEKFVTHFVLNSFTKLFTSIIKVWWKNDFKLCCYLTTWEIFVNRFIRFQTIRLFCQYNFKTNLKKKCVLSQYNFQTNFKKMCVFKSNFVKLENIVNSFCNIIMLWSNLRHKLVWTWLKWVRLAKWNFFTLV